ncbi:MAG: hypothetical protein PHV51_09955 [Methanosarcinaceae archaeon]|nr:hypothetical protein [Methanosarcinaceae archaeon]
MKDSNLHLSGLILAFSILLSIAAVPSAFAQTMGQGYMGADFMRGGMHGEQFGHMDERFMGFGGHTLLELSSMFGVPVEDIIADLGLPADTDPGMTIAEIEAESGVSVDMTANYMAFHMRNIPASVSKRGLVDLRQQALQGMRTYGQTEGLNFMMQGMSAYGNYTTFSFDESGEISNFAVSGDLLFDSVKVSDFDFINQEIYGASAVYIGSSSIISLYDCPQASLQVRALAAKNVVFDLAEDVRASLEAEDADEVVLIKISKNNFEGYIIASRDYLEGDDGGDGTAEVAAEIRGETVTVNLVRDSRLVFRAVPMLPQQHQTLFRYSENWTYMHDRINRGIAGGNVGAEISIRNRGQSVSMMNYTPVSVRVKETARNRIVLGVSSELEDGQVVTVNLDRETMDLTYPERIRMWHDGTQIRRAASIDELFAGNPKPLCYLMYDNETATMAMYIPRFSEREIIIDLGPESAENETSPGNETVENGEETEEEGEDEETDSGEKSEETEETESDEGKTTPGFEVLFSIGGLGAASFRKLRK